MDERRETFRKVNQVFDFELPVKQAKQLFKPQLFGKPYAVYPIFFFKKFTFWQAK